MPILIENVFKNSSNRLGELITQSSHLEQLNQIFRKTLPKAFSKHCRVANYDEKKLKVIADTPAWSTKIHYLVPDLMKKLQPFKEFSNIEAIECITRPQESFSNSKLQKIEKNRLELSPKTKQLLKNLSQSTKDKNLKAALQKISN
ncbi:MAG: DUF721 domain-containing protein [Gammaproteobacteria bacterium]|nr:DUF721 domain-containing protein [Gammaproteobacteria bacterium]